MQVRAEEISAIIRKQIEGFGREVEVSETGTIISVGDGIARIYGLENAMAGELVEFPHNITGMALNVPVPDVLRPFLGIASERARENLAG